jgi:hypothetical protein
VQVVLTMTEEEHMQIRNQFSRIRLVLALAALPVLATGCLVAAAAGAGAAIHLSDRGAESLVKASVDQAYAATQQVFRDMNITEGKSSSEEDAGVETRELEGSTTDRDITVTIKSEGDGAHVEVVARTSAVTWDKDLAREILEKIVGAI